VIVSVSIIAIAAAALFGSAIGSFFEARLWAVVWSAPVVALLGGLALLIAPEMRDSTSAPEWLRAAVIELAQPALLGQALVACVTGALVSSAAVGYVQRSRQGSVWLPSMGDASRKRRVAAVAEPGRTAASRLEQRVEGVGARAPERLERPRRNEPLPVFEVAPETVSAAARLAPRRTEPAPEPRLEANNRKQARRRALLSGQLLWGAGQSTACTIQNLSVGGAQVKLPYVVNVPNSCWLIDVSNGLAHQAEAAWRRGASIGLRFHASYDLKSPKDPQLEGLRQQWLALAPR
jgi:hypothetical protein